MKPTLRSIVFGLPIVAFAVACGGPPESAAPPPPPPVAAIPEPPPAETAKAPEPTPEEKKKAEAAKALEKDRTKWQADNAAAKARWTPELHAEAKTLVEKAFPSGKAAIQAAMTEKGRTPGAADRDKYRHPVETLDFFGFKPTMTVLEFGPGEGWFTELLAPALAKKGKLLATNGDPSGPPEERSTFYAQRFQGFLDLSPELFGKVETVKVDNKTPSLAGRENSVDMIVVTRELHGMVNQGKLDAWLAAFSSALKNGGILAVEEHRAKADAVAEEASKNGYLPEKWVVDHVESAGFKLAGKSEINANPKDTKDYAKGVWSLPPTLQQGDTDREKYLAIGESDRMTLKFTKVAKKADKPATDKPATTTPPAKK